MCQQSKVSIEARIILFQPLEPASYLFEQVTIYFTIHLPTSKRFDSAFTIVNRFSKYVTIIPCNVTYAAFDLARVFYDHLVYKFSMPKEKIFDRDGKFLSKSQ